MNEEIKNNNSNDTNPEYNEENFDWKALLFKCFLHWPWFLGSIVICIICAWMYLHFATPIYKTTASVLIKEEDKKNSKSMNGLSDLTQLGIFSSTQSFDNEVEILRSKNLVRNVIEELNLNTTYFQKRGLKSVELYNDSLFEVILPAIKSERLGEEVKFKTIYYPNGSMDVEGLIGKKKYNKHFTRLPGLMPTEVGTFCFQRAKATKFFTENQEIEINVQNPIQIAEVYSNKLDVAPSSKTTTIALLTFNDSQKERAANFINKLVEVYNNNANLDKNEIAEKTRQFIDERIKIINDDLFNTEKDLENFKRQAGLTDLKSDAELVIKENSEYNKMQAENATQLNIIRYLRKAISGKSYTVLPTQIGITDQALAIQIDAYNKLVIDRNRLLKNSTINNPVIANQDLTIKATQEAIRATLHSIEQGLTITQRGINAQAGKYNEKISKAPTQERQFLSISRQQEIKSQLYLMLLQKREQNSIELASTANNAKIIDAALADDLPISPKRSIIYLVALVIGVALPIGCLYINDLIRFRIEGHEDVEKLTKCPIIGDIALTDESERQGSIAVRENVNNLMAETFRSIRTNLKFMLGDNKKVIMVTSTTSGEGKTFTSTNLAISFSLLGKSVVLVGLDIRKPGLNKVFKIHHFEIGLTQFLAHPNSTDLMSLVKPSNVAERLDILPSGTIPPNPTELIDSPALQKAITILKEKYDYVILDTAPIGLVSDTQLIGKVADLAIYVCRADYTPRADFMLIEELRKQKRLPNLCCIINGVDFTQRKYGYYYGYGKKYGYGGYGKHYGYGYGYDKTSKNEKLTERHTNGNKDHTKITE
ncbi:MAG: polysaccharide biosynthesis tyrosine autokinase [Bacteroidales bacterium]|nr:polysaccharide biosynthesis tyrosine autokinase [Bacteroidales bacterium]